MAATCTSFLGLLPKGAEGFGKQRGPPRQPLRPAALPARHGRVKKECVAVAGEERRGGKKSKSEETAPRSRREFVLNGSSALVLGSLFDSLVDNSRPAGLGLHQYGDYVTLGLCPPRPNCVSTAEDLNDDSHFIPPWTYNPQEGKGDRGIKTPISQTQAMEELVDVVKSTDCEGYEVNIVTSLGDYLYVEYKDPRVGFVDDVEFFFSPGDMSRVEYRTVGLYKLNAVDDPCTSLKAPGFNP
jgi:uncharacterized protein (DUF1499 family)